MKVKHSMNLKSIKHELQTILSGKSGNSHDALIQTISHYLRTSQRTSPVAEEKHQNKAKETERLITFATGNNLFSERFVGAQTSELGSSLIEPIAITGFSFGSSQFVVNKSNDTIPLILNESSVEVDTELTFEGPDTLDITFELDLQSSVVLDSAGVNWIIPKINVLKE